MEPAKPAKTKPAPTTYQRRTLVSTTPAASSARRPSAPAAGILNRPPAHLLLASYDFGGERSPSATRSTLERLRILVHHELRSDLDELTASSPKELPPAETGELGFIDGHDRAHLTITLGVAKSGFDALGVASVDQPQDLILMPWPQLGDAPAVAANGDLVLQICSDNTYINEHVVRRIAEELGDSLRLAWAVTGEQRYTTRAGRTAREEGRALIGFLDGTDNLHPRKQPADAQLVFVDPDRTTSYPALPVSGPSGPYGPVGPVFPADLRSPPAREPEWTRGGTYMVARASVNDLSTWDRQTLGTQEQIVGRFKVSGAALDLNDDEQLQRDEPYFAQHQDDRRVALNSHIRKANPRRVPEDEMRRIFRRGYSLISAQPATGLLGGLVFICFGRTISTQFEFITRAWTNNPDFPEPGTGVDAIRPFDATVLAGGYFFVPAVARASQPWTWVLPLE